MEREQDWKMRKTKEAIYIRLQGVAINRDLRGPSYLGFTILFSPNYGKLAEIYEVRSCV